MTIGRMSETYTRCEEEEEERGASRMDYHWLGTHDPISIDANLAHIDFDDFKNEDLQNAFAFSIPSYDGGSSSGTDMSICKSEALFSSLKEYPGEDSIIQDSLTQEEFNYSDQLKVNKNAYRLTSLSMAGSINQEQQHQHTGSLPEDGKYTTWSNVLRQRERGAGEGHQVEDQGPHQGGATRHRGRPRTREENNNEDSNRKSRSLPNISKPVVRQAWPPGEEKFAREILEEDEPRLLSLYMRGRADRNSWNGTSRSSEEYDSLVDADGNQTKGVGLLTKEKDAINELLRKSRLTSIQENAEASSSSSGDEATIRPVPTPRQRSISSMSTTPSLNATPPLGSNAASIQGGVVEGAGSLLATPPGQGGATPLFLNSSRSSKRHSGHFPDLDFLEEDCALWDAFFTNKKTGGRFQSVLKPALPLEEYLRRTGGSTVRDVNSLRVLLPSTQHHLLAQTKSPIKQVCESLSLLNTCPPRDRSPELLNTCQPRDRSPEPGVEVVRVIEAWAPIPEQVQGYVPQWERFEAGGGENLNLLNNNNGNSSVKAAAEQPARLRGRISRADRADKVLKRRSYHPQDGLSQLLTSPNDENLSRARRSYQFPKSGSQGNLCDSWLDSPAGSPVPSSSRGQGATPHSTSDLKKSSKTLAAEYPFQAHLCMPHQNINFDLTHKRGLFVNLYSAVERLLLYQDPSPSYSNRAAARCVLLHEFCPALHAILEDGLKEEVITSFGRMKTSVWRFIEAVMQAGPAQRNTCDLVMLLNTKFSSEEDFKKFSGFVIGLLNMSSLHLWFSKLKWSMDVLLRFYERHAFICALHKETRLLFDELNFCLQRLFSLPFHIDMPFNSGILEEIPGEEMYKKREHCSNCACSRTTSGSQGTNTVTTPTSEAGSEGSGRSSRLTRSRIPRPISLPKRLEEKLSVRAANSAKRSFSHNKTTPGGSEASEADRAVQLSGQSPLRAVPPPVAARPSPMARPKSRVRDTIKLFDAQSGAKTRPRLTLRDGKSSSSAASGLVKTRPLRPMTSPKTGGGEGMAGDSGEDHFK